MGVLYSHRFDIYDLADVRNRKSTSRGHCAMRGHNRDHKLGPRQVRVGHDHAIGFCRDDDPGRGMALDLRHLFTGSEEAGDDVPRISERDTFRDNDELHGDRADRLDHALATQFAWTR